VLSPREKSAEAIVVMGWAREAEICGEGLTEWEAESLVIGREVFQMFA